MPIESLAQGRLGPMVAMQPSVTLEQRVSAPTSVSVPLAEAFYRALSRWENSGHPSVLSFLTSYRSTDGDRPFATSATQLTALQGALKRLKDEGLEQSQLYRETYQAFTSVFAAEGFIAQFVQAVFDPQVQAELEEASTW